jgi:hypothetical protein
VLCRWDILDDYDGVEQDYDSVEQDCECAGESDECDEQKFVFISLRRIVRSNVGDLSPPLLGSFMLVLTLLLYMLSGRCCPRLCHVFTLLDAI